MREFTDSDVTRPYAAGSWDGRISADRADLIDAPMWWHKQGRQQTASGYGAKLVTPHKINFNGKLYRIYCTIYSNSGTCWFTTRGKRIVVS